MMESNYPWASPLGIKAENIQSWKKECPPDKPFILWLLQNKKINEKQYFLWAKNFYQLPVLKKDFFEKKQPPIALFEKYSSNWPLHALPLAMRKNKLFIACLEPLKDLEPSQSMQFILCPPSLMAKWRPELQNPISSPPPLNLKVVRAQQQPPSLKLHSKPQKESVKKTIQQAPPPPSRSNILPLHANKSSAQSIFDTILTRSQNYFYSSMILVYHNKTLIPSYWHGDWSKPATIKPIDYSSPGIFRIVMKTKHPFHGQPRPNPSNNEFFKTWMKESYPEHMTLVPIFINKKIYGILLGCASKTRIKQFQLKHVENLAKQVAEKIVALKTAS